MATYKCENCGREAEWLDGQKDIYCAMCGYGKLLPLRTQTEPVSEVPCSDRVIKPCPFCGNEDLEMWNCSKDNVPNHVYCLNCQTDGPRRENKKEAIEAWNERAL